MDFETSMGAILGCGGLHQCGNATSPMGSRSDSSPAELVAVRAAARPRALNVWRRWFCVVVSRVVTASHRSLQLFALQTRTVQEPIRPSALTTIHRGASTT